jgi:hypothetical protein
MRIGGVVGAPVSIGIIETGIIGTPTCASATYDTTEPSITKDPKNIEMRFIGLSAIRQGFFKLSSTFKATFKILTKVRKIG